MSNQPREGVSMEKQRRRIPGEDAWLDELEETIQYGQGASRRDKMRTILRAYRANLLTNAAPPVGMDGLREMVKDWQDQVDLRQNTIAKKNMFQSGVTQGLKMAITDVREQLESALASTAEGAPPTFDDVIEWLRKQGAVYGVESVSGDGIAGMIIDHFNTRTVYRATQATPAVAGDPPFDALKATPSAFEPLGKERLNRLAKQAGAAVPHHKWPTTRNKAETEMILAQSGAVEPQITVTTGATAGVAPPSWTETQWAKAVEPMAEMVAGQAFLDGEQVGAPELDAVSAARKLQAEWETNEEEIQRFADALTAYADARVYKICDRLEKVAEQCEAGGHGSRGRMLRALSDEFAVNYLTTPRRADQQGEG
jgi:hypothetical protein